MVAQWISESAGGIAKGLGIASDGKEKIPKKDVWLLRIITWNLGGNAISRDDLLGKLMIPDGELADIFIFGMQEVIPLTIGNTLLGDPGPAEVAIEDRFAAVLRMTGQDFVRVASVSMVGIFLLIYIRQEYSGAVEDLEFDRVKTGLGQIVGNKGGVSIRFTLQGLQLSFINVHLASGRENSAARNQSLASIIDHSFRHTEHDAHGNHWVEKTSFAQPVSERVVKPKPNVTVCLGDFNFRLALDNKDLEAWKKGRGVLNTAQQVEFLKHDQWLRGKVEGLEDFEEGELTFPPTYKYEPGSNAMSRKRLPAWTDRIMYKTSVPANVPVNLLDYGSDQDAVNTSDHRPVGALLRIGIDPAWFFPESDKDPIPTTIGNKLSTPRRPRLKRCKNCLHRWEHQLCDPCFAFASESCKSMMDMLLCRPPSLSSRICSCTSVDVPQALRDTLAKLPDHSHVAVFEMQANFCPIQLGHTKCCAEIRRTLLDLSPAEATRPVYLHQFSEVIGLIQVVGLQNEMTQEDVLKCLKPAIAGFPWLCYDDRNGVLEELRKRFPRLEFTEFIMRGAEEVVKKQMWRKTGTRADRFVHRKRLIIMPELQEEHTKAVYAGMKAQKIDVDDGFCFMGPTLNVLPNKELVEAVHDADMYTLQKNLFPAVVDWLLQHAGHRTLATEQAESVLSYINPCVVS